MKSNKGVALIMAVGILAVLAVIATSFALNMRLEYKAASNYYEGVKARYLAEAGLQRAIAELKTHVKQSAFDHLGETDWVGEKSDSSIGSTATWEIKDTQRWVNVNNAKDALLQNLFDQLDLPDGTSSEALSVKIRNVTDYTSLEELKSRGRLTDDEYNAIKDHVTVRSYIDSNAGGRSPININTADLITLQTVLRGVITQDADDLALEIYNRVRGLGSYGTADYFTSWNAFNTFVDGLVGTSPNFTTFDAAQANTVKNNCNPNKTLNKVTTEFCFNSGGYYSVTATGIAGGAPRTLNAVVKIYDIKNYTTKAQFAAAGATAKRVTWLNSCPVNSNALFGSLTLGTTQVLITDSVKLGYWDNFEEDRSGYSVNQWPGASFQTGRGEGGSYALVGTEGQARSLWNATTGWDWTFDNFSLRVYVNEYDTSNAVQMRDVSWIVLRENDGLLPFTDAPSVMHTRNGVLSWDNTGYGYLNSVVGLEGETGEVTFMTVDEYMSQTGYGSGEAIANRHRYGTGQIRILSKYENDDIENYDGSDDRGVLTYSPVTTFNILANGSNVSINAWVSGNTASFLRTNIPDVNTTGGRVVLYSNNVKTAWDNIRIIPDDGRYTSQIISPTGSNVRWATITGTITHPVSAGGDAGDILLRTSLGGLATGPSINLDTTSTDPYLALDSYDPASSIQFGATLTTPSPYQQTPVLEDVTITYLPKTDIISYSFSQ